MLKQQLWASLARLSTDTAFREYLQTEAQNAVQILKNSDGRALYMAQGKVQFIDELLDLLEKARSR